MSYRLHPLIAVPFVAGVLAVGGRLAFGSSASAVPTQAPSPHVREQVETPVIRGEEDVHAVPPAPPPTHAEPSAAHLEVRRSATSMSRSSTRTPTTSSGPEALSTTGEAGSNGEADPRSGASPQQLPRGLRPGENPFLSYETLRHEQQRHAARVLDHLAPSRPVKAPSQIPAWTSPTDSPRLIRVLANGIGVTLTRPSSTPEDRDAPTLKAQANLFPITVKVVGEFR
jgi:hypothetical protein